MTTQRTIRALQYLFTFVSWVGAFGLFGTIAATAKPLVEVESRLTYAVIMILVSGLPCLMVLLIYRQLARLFKLLRDKLEISSSLIQVLRRLGWLFAISFASELIMYATFFMTKESYAALYRYLELTETHMFKWVELAFPSLGSGVGNVVMFFIVMGIAKFLDHHLSLREEVHTLQREAELTI